MFSYPAIERPFLDWLPKYLFIAMLDFTYKI